VIFSLGRVFIPTLDEINVDLAAVRIPSISMEQSKDLDFRVERALLALPEVSLVFSKAGTANLVFDAMPSNASDNYVMLKPKDQWPPAVRTKDDVQRRIQQATAPIVGNFYEMTQPIQMRFNELISGARSDVTLAIYGDDLNSMGVTAKRVAAVLAKIRGVAEVHVAQTRGFPSFDIKFDRNGIARYGLTMEDVADTVSAALGGRPAGLLFNGDRRYQIVVRVPDLQRNDLEALGALPVMLPAAKGSPRGSVPLRQLASFEFSEGLNEISRDNGKRRIFVEANRPRRAAPPWVVARMGRPIQESSAGDPPAAVRRSNLPGHDLCRLVHGAWQHAAGSHGFYGGASCGGGWHFCHRVTWNSVLNLRSSGLHCCLWRRGS
jgi:cobalt-zinc-cadmium resistance protein CzcA